MNSPRLMVALLALVVVSLWLWPPPVLLAQVNSVVVEGQVANGTAGGGSVAGLTVVLHQESSTIHNDLETVTDEEGRFRFDGIEYDPALAYGVSVRYQGALYGIDLDLSAGSPPSVSMTLYEAVYSEDMLSVSLASVLFAQADESTQTLSALEIVRIVNSTDLTYVPGPEPMNLLRFGLPPGAQGLQVDTGLAGADFVQVDRGFALLASVPPGEHEVMYAYQFPYSGTEAPFTKSLAYGAELLRVLAPEEVVSLSSDQLGDTETVTIGESLYQLLQATDLPRGANISLEIKGLPQASLSDRLGRRAKSVRFEYIAPVGLGVIMATLVGYALWRRGSRRLSTDPYNAEAPAVDDEDPTLRRMIADLDRSLEEGTITQEEHLRRRNVLSARLTPLARD